MKNQLKFLLATMLCLSFSLTSCSEKGSGCYYSNLEKENKVEQTEIITTTAITKESLEAE